MMSVTLFTELQMSHIWQHSYKAATMCLADLPVRGRTCHFGDQIKAPKKKSNHHLKHLFLTGEKEETAVKSELEETFMSVVCVITDWMLQMFFPCPNIVFRLRAFCFNRKLLDLQITDPICSICMFSSMWTTGWEFSDMDLEWDPETYSSFA